MTDRLQIKLGYHDGQREVADDTSRFKVLACGRRWGKTRMAVLEAVKVMMQGGRVWWMAPTFALANEGWYPLVKMAQQIPGCSVHKGEHRVQWGKGMIEVRTADDPSKLRGAGLDLAIVDEAAYCKLDEVWEAIRPALTDRKGKGLFISTPNGLDKPFHEFWATDREHWRSWQFPTSSNPYIDPDEIEAAREDLGSLLFSQEHLAEFIQAGGGMFKAEWFRYHTPITRDGLIWLQAGERLVDYRECRRFATVDLAASTKTHADYTVICAVAVHEGDMFVLDVDRARREGPDIVPAIRRMVEQHDLSVVHIEHVGFQLSLIQAARRDGLPVQELRPDTDKISRALPLSARLEAGDVWFNEKGAWLSELERELLAFPETAHDDQVDALAYAAAVMTSKPRPRLSGWAADQALRKDAGFKVG